MTASRRNALVAAVAATVVLGMAVGVWPVSSAPEDEIKAVHSGKVMDVAGSTTPGTPVLQGSSNGSDEQAWNVVELARINGWPLVLIQSRQTGLVLDVVAGSTGAGAPLVQKPWAASASQLWLLLPYGNTGWEIILNIKSGRVADVAGASSDDGASVIQWDWRGGANQIWDVPTPEPLPTTTTTTEATTTTTEPPTT
ncbi:MAG: RICIN domain-containing protein, partial [Actinomycetota bacterium]|nr:RICIN domain-containing protein [Actinomycetota bacterium]